MTADILIIGAGLAGLMAGRALQDRGFSVALVDRGRNVGGRMATRQMGGGAADLGAQFFTVRENTFRQYVDQWIADGLVFEWSRGWSDGSLKRTHPDGNPRYAVRGGMVALARHLAEGLEIQLETEIMRIEPGDPAYIARDANRKSHECRALLLTSPVPESLQMLAAGGVRLHKHDHEALNRIQYGPSLAAVFEVEGELTLPEPGAIQRTDAAIAWIADNQAKGISPDAKIVTVQASAWFSRDNWTTPDDGVLWTLRVALEEFFTPGTKVVSEQLVRWQYALPLITHPAHHILAHGLPPLAFAGDAFGGRGRMEGAALSGLDAAQALAEALK